MALQAANALLVWALLAAPTEVVEPREAAAAEFQAASEAYKNGEYAQALAGFARAQELSPHDRVEFNIALCLAALGRHREAAQRLESMVDSEQLSSEVRSQARATAHEYRAKLGTLSFEGPAGLAVRLDDGQQCSLPCSLSVDAGTYTASVDRPSAAWSQTIVIGAGQSADIAVTTPEPPPPVVRPQAASVERDETVATAQPRDRRRFRPSALTWTGVAVASVGVGGVIGFGLTARSLHDDYRSSPSVGTRDRGLLMRNLTNASIGVAAVGGALVLIDLLRKTQWSR